MTAPAPTTTWEPEVKCTYCRDRRWVHQRDPHGGGPALVCCRCCNQDGKAMTENACTPVDPTVGGWHWLEHSGVFIVAEWSLFLDGCFRIIDRDSSGNSFVLLFDPAGAARYGYRYAGPCPTPAEMAEREKAWTKDRADLVLYYENLADERDAAEAERDGLLRALASVVAALWEDRDDFEWYSAWDFLEVLRDQGLIDMQMPDGRSATEEDDTDDATPVPTPLGRAALAAAKE